MLEGIREFSRNHASALMAVVLVLLLVIAICLTLYFTNRSFFCPVPIKSGFRTVGPGGHAYDTAAMRFESTEDKKLAIAALSASLKKDGIEYTNEQLYKLPDPFVIMALEPEDADDETRLKARVVVMVDPDYQAAVAATAKARRNKNTLESETERIMIYNLLLKYFSAVKRPLSVKLPYWPDYLLIQTLRSLQSPPSAAFTSTIYTKGGSAPDIDAVLT